MSVSLGIDKIKTVMNYYQKQKLKRQALAAANVFDVTQVKTYRAHELHFDPSLFVPMPSGKEIDTLFSSEGGLMPATSVMISGGPGSGKTTVTLDLLAALTKKGYRCLFISGEMDAIGYVKYAKRMPVIQNVETLFLRDYALQVKPVLEHVLDIGYDVVATDSIAEVIDLFKDGQSTTEGIAEHWFLQLIDKHKKGSNTRGVHTSFVNIQQMTKAGIGSGSNRLPHMHDGVALIQRNKETGERKLWFSKNRDCALDYAVHFSIDGDGVRYHFAPIDDEE